MSFKSSLIDKILAFPLLVRVLRHSKRIVLPGFEGVSLYDVTIFFYNGLSQGYITTRAAAISFSLFLAIFPFLIFLFSIIPFIPIENFQQSLLLLIKDFLPGTTYETVKGTIIDIVTRPRSSLLIINLILTLYFSTNGVNSLIDAFNNTYHDLETRSSVKQYLMSSFIVFIISFLLIIAIGLITFGSELLRWILSDSIDNSFFLVTVLEILRWLIILLLLLMAISIVYYLAPARRKHFRFISAGSMLATLLILITTLGFNFYVDNFSRYNAIYGSLATLMIVLVWIYINSISLLIGFELNASIFHAKRG
ncbi:MAG: YihY/virulence factor BrkB family protein [Bacteroidales bacterium]|nr:YihY/virulence factor BrkB family protein [Bacteroidales bacterium]